MVDKEILEFDPDRFPMYVKGYNEVKTLIIKGYSIDEIKEVTGFDDDLIKKYQEVANSHNLNNYVEMSRCQLDKGGMR